MTENGSLGVLEYERERSTGVLHFFEADYSIIPILQ
jgi:hypothetical protein